MKKTNLTEAQLKVYEYVAQHGEVEVGHMKLHGLDPRAANNLVKGGMLTLMGGVYRQRGRKKTAPKAEATPKAEEVEMQAERTEIAAHVTEKQKAVEKPVKKASKPKTEKREKVVANPTGKCLCGCGGDVGTKRRFSLGHDAKLHSLVLRIARGKADLKELPDLAETAEYLVNAPWMTEEIREAIGL